MNIQEMTSNAIAQSMTTLGGEMITIESQEITAVLDMTSSQSEIMGGFRTERDCTAEFPTDQTIEIRDGMTVHARGKEWKIDTHAIGQAMTTIQLIEPNRQPE